MALSGTINGTTANPGIISQIRWSAVQDQVNNRSTITATGILNWTAQISSWGTGTFYLSIDGQQGSNTDYVEISYNSYTQCISITRTVDHNLDGSKSLTLKFWGSMPGTTVSSIDCEGEITLNPIPRASDFEIPSSIEMGQTLAITINRATNTFTHDVKLTFGDQEVSKNGVSTAASLAIPMSWCSEIPDNTEGTGLLTVTTKNGNSTIGTKSKQISLKVPASVVPNLSLAAALVDGFQGLYLQGLSKCKLTGTASGSYGSTIDGQIQYSGAGYSGSGSSYTTGALNVQGDVTFTATVKDSRGRISQKQVAITVIAYAKPTLNSVSVDRCLQNGTLAPDGTYASVRCIFGCSSVNGKNAVACTVDYKLPESSGWSGNTSLVSGQSKIIGNGTLDIQKVYLVRFRATDSVGQTTEVQLEIPNNAYMLVVGTDRFSVGMYPPGPGAHIAYPVTVEGDVNADAFHGKADSAESAGIATKVERLNQLFEDSTANDLTALMRRKVDLIRQIASGQDGVYCVHAGWSGVGWGFTIGAHYAGANVTDALFIQGEEIDFIRKNGNSYGEVKRYLPS